VVRTETDMSTEARQFGSATTSPLTRLNDAPHTLIPRLLRTSDAARYLGLGSKVIRQLIVSGRLPYVQMKPGNSPFLLDRRDLDKFIEAHKVPVTTKVHRQ
jgi:excisionase family DNA binding protein